MNIVLDRMRREREYGQIKKSYEESFSRQRRYPFLITGLCDGALDAFVAAFASDEKNGTSLVIAKDEAQAERIRAFCVSCGLRAAVYPSRRPVLYNIVSSHELEHARLSVLSGIVSGTLDVAVTVPEAALQYTVPYDKLVSGIRQISVGDTLDIREFTEFLVSAGYVPCELVDGRGQFSTRGGIIDVFVPQLEYPVRMELFGDEVDSIGFFDTMTQRKTENIKSFSVICAREVVISSEVRPALLRHISELIKKAESAESKSTLSHERECIDSETEAPFADKYISFIYKEHTTLLDYLPKEKTLVFASEHATISERLSGYEGQMGEDITELLKNALISPQYKDFSLPSDSLFGFFEKNSALILDTFTSQYPGKLSELFTFFTRKPPSFSESFENLKDDILGFIRNGYSVLIVCENSVSASNLGNMLSDAGVKNVFINEYTRVDDVPRGLAVITCGAAPSFELINSSFVCISQTEKGGMRLSIKKRRSDIKQSSKKKILSYADLSVGDLVVHEAHGIGRYVGIENIKNYDGTRRDHIKIQYAGTDVLYVPCEQIDLVSKYIGPRSDDASMKLSKLGGSDWHKTKARVKAEVREMAKELIKLYAERQRRPGYAFPPDDEMQREFESTFEYEETDAQLQAAREIKEDMEKSVPMDRLLCGDVGFGKTEVALRAAFKAVLGGKQVAILVPTTILASQHYRTTLSRMRGFPLKVAMLSRFSAGKEQSATLRALKRGDIDILIGTHRILSDDVVFSDLGLVIIDEEQRFGVAHKEKLKQISKNVDVLTLTATPIPRTLGMAMNSIRDMSVLDEAPENRRPVQTYVMEYDEIIINEAIRRELSRGGQVFYLHNRVESIYSTASRLKTRFPDAQIAVAHGQMEKEELSDVWQSLVAGETDILVCTTIIETGVDVPNANTLIIENADTMGLSQLHQIRGRVGRSQRLAYAYFTYARGKALSDISSKRLTAIRDFTEFGSGFKIALRDLEIRGAGDVLGARQHGHMESIGYDLYIKILDEAVLEETDAKKEQKPECVINIGRDSYIPKSYIPSEAQRIDIYKKIARVSTEADADDIADELLDRFGDLCPSVETLLDAALCRALGRECGFAQIDERNGSVVIYPLRLDLSAWSQMADIFPGRILINPSEKPYVSCRKPPKEPIFSYIRTLLKKYIQIISKKQ
ncbi:MAG: transcription-repair coupling factor [Eubacteriales bacterium]